MISLLKNISLFAKTNHERMDTAASPAAAGDVREKDDKVDERRSQIARVLVLFAGAAGLIVAAFLLTMFIAVSKGEWRGTAWFINGEQPFTARGMLLSMCSGFVFGLVDNCTLFFGLDALDPFLPGDELTRAGWANAFSGGVGAFASAFAASAIYLTTGFRGGPVYGDAIGVVAGCIAGIYIARKITGKK